MRELGTRRFRYLRILFIYENGMNSFKTVLEVAFAALFWQWYFETSNEPESATTEELVLKVHNSNTNNRQLETGERSRDCWRIQRKSAAYLEDVKIISKVGVAFADYGSEQFSTSSPTDFCGDLLRWVSHEFTTVGTRSNNNQNSGYTEENQQRTK